MSVSGRTLWWMKDCAWWRREAIVELGEEFGPAGPAVLDWLSSEAKQQSVNEGRVKTGYRAIARGVFTDVDSVREVVARAVELEALKDFEEAGRTFTCRISGFKRDQERALANTRQQRKRDREAAADEGSTTDGTVTPERDSVTPDRDAVTDGHGVSRTVTSREEKSREEESSLRSDSVAASADDAADADPVKAVWEAYDRTRRQTLGERSIAKLTADRQRLIQRRLKEWPLEDLVDAVQGWRLSPHNRGENDRHTPYCDVELLLRDAAHIEKFRDLHRAGEQPTADFSAVGGARGASRFDQRRGRQRTGEPCPNGTADPAAVAAWEAALPALRERVGETTFDIWIAPVHAHRFTGDTLVVGCPAERLGWLRERASSAIAAAVEHPVEIVACTGHQESRAA